MDTEQLPAVASLLTATPQYPWLTFSLSYFRGLSVKGVHSHFKKCLVTYLIWPTRSHLMNHQLVASIPAPCNTLDSLSNFLTFRPFHFHSKKCLPVQIFDASNNLWLWPPWLLTAIAQQSSLASFNTADWRFPNTFSFSDRIFLFSNIPRHEFGEH